MAPTNAALTNSYTLKLPVNDGDNGQFLKTDGLGVLSWDTVSSGGGGGGTAAPNNIVTLSESVDGSRTDFSMSVTPASAQNLIVSVNGVVQKPNAGTTIANSAEGYCVSSATLKFATAPANGSSIFITEQSATTASDRIVEGNSNVDIFDDNSTSRAVVNLDGNEKFRINEGGQIGLAGANYGTDGQVLTSQGSGAAAQWETIPIEVANDTSPQLGGNLDVQASEITTSTTNGNIKFTPNGTGVIEVKGAGGADGTLQLNCSQNSHGVKIKSPAHSASASYTLTLPVNDGNANQVLKTDGSGVLAWVDQTTDTNTTDLVSDTSPQLGGDLDTNSHNISLDDSHFVMFGDSNDLRIRHDGTNSVITGYTNQTWFQGDNLYLSSATAQETYLYAVENGAVNLYYDNSKKFETTAAGVNVSGIQRNSTAGYNYLLIGSTDASGAALTFDGDSNGDGAGGDYAYIEHGTDGDLTIHCDNPAGDSQFELYVGNGSTTAMVAAAAGAVNLYYNGSKKFETTSTGTTISGGVRADGSISGATCNTFRAGTSLTNYGVFTARNQSDVNVHNAGFQVENSSTGSNTTNQFMRSVDLNSSSWAHAKYSAKSHRFLVSGSADTDTKIQMDSDGLKFNNDQASDNALNDYEEGTWTPTVHVGAVTSGSDAIAYSVQQGWSVKIGRFVQASFYMTFTAMGDGNNFSIGGLPYTSLNLNPSYSSSGVLGYKDCNFTNNATQQLYIGNNASLIYFYNNNAGTHSPASTKLVSTERVANSLYGSVTYRAA